LSSKLCLLLGIAITVVKCNISDLVLCSHRCFVDEVVESGEFLLYFGESAVEFVLFTHREPTHIVHVSGVTDLAGCEHKHTQEATQNTQISWHFILLSP